MPKHRPPTSGYARLAQEEEDRHDFYDESDDDDLHGGAPSTVSQSAPRYAPISSRSQMQ
ncbi:Phosphatidylinositol 4-kinase LSB6, partial [Elasticomyces elasticus]